MDVNMTLDQYETAILFYHIESIFILTRWREEPILNEVLIGVQNKLRYADSGDKPLLKALIKHLNSCKLVE